MRPVCALLLVVAASADEIVLSSGGRVAGEIVAEDDRQVTVRLPNGTMAIPRSKIAEIVREDRRDYLRREAKSAASTRAAVQLLERAFALSPDEENRRDLAKALLARAAELLQLFRLDETEAALARLREVAPEAPSDDPSARLAAERANEREAKAQSLRALREDRFDEALVHIEEWRLRAPDGDEAVHGTLLAAHLGAARAAESRGALRPALDHYRMAEASADLDRLAPISVLEAMHGGDLERAARMLEPLARYGDPAVPRFLAAVLAHLRGEVADAVAAYAEAARLAEGEGAEGCLSYDEVRAYAAATLKQAIARPPQEGQKRWRETFLAPLSCDRSCAEFLVYAASEALAGDAAEKAAEIYERIVSDLFGAPPEGPPAEVVLHPTREAYVAADPTPEGSPLSGLALGREPTAGVCYDTLDEEGAMLVRIEVDAGQSRWLTDTLPHELVHLAQRRGWRTFRKGHWLDEGLATLYESQEAQDSRLTLWRQVKEESIPLPELLSLRSTPPDRALLFYLEAHAFCRYLRGLGGPEQWRRFLDAFGDADFLTAVRTTYGVESAADLERAFRAWRG